MAEEERMTVDERRRLICIVKVQNVGEIDSCPEIHLRNLLVRVIMEMDIWG